MTKAALRQQFLVKRKALSAENVQIASKVICQRFMAMLPSYAGTSSGLTLHLFLPIVRQNEVDTWPIVHYIWRNFPAIQITTSITDPVAQRLNHYILTPDVLLSENRWGIPEPTLVDQYVAVDTIDVVLVPLLVVDKTGHRIGYGGGFYDRFLADCRPDCQKIGLSLFEPVDCINHSEPTDIRLNQCLTPAATYFFK